MAKRKSNRWSLQDLDLELTPAQREIVGLLLTAVALVTLLGLFDVSRGVVIDVWVRVLRVLFGWGAYPAAVGLGVGGVVLFYKSLRRDLEIAWQAIIGWEATFVAVLGLLHLLAFAEDPRALADAGAGGGWVGWALSDLLIASMGTAVAGLILLLLGGVGLGLAWQVSWPQVREGALRLGDLLPRAFRSYRQWRADAGRRREGSLPTSVMVASEDGSQSKAEQSNQRRPSSRRRRRSGRVQPEAELPPLDLLYDVPSAIFSEAEIQRRARTIEETLSSFGVPAQVVDIKTGPVVTQFGVEPGFVELRSGEQRKVRVNKIASLRKDLALALAAAPIRVEAPVPGRSVVGIEVPNGETSLVSLRGVVESKAFQDVDSSLRIALGRDVSGTPIVADLAVMPHLLIAGATGTGKSVCINAIVTCLLLQNSPQTLSLVMVDPKRVELLRFNGLPHLISPVETEPEKVVGILKWLTRHMDTRYQRFVDMHARNIDDYNIRATRRGGEIMPYIVLVIDELADLMMVAPDQIEPLICRLAQMARATGIHLVMATQRPSVDVVTGLIKANFPARVSFAVTSQVDSRVVLDTTGAESLLGSGDMLFMAPDSSNLVRIQGCWVSDEEMERVVGFWKQSHPDEVPTAEDAPWEDMDEEGGEADPLLEEAIEIVQAQNRASASFLQRRMRIGYPRAARLIEQMEELGVVGPAKDGGRSREVLIEEDVDPADLDY